MDGLNVFYHFDGGHFLGIAQNGYVEKFQYAFFPLYPLLINIWHYVVGNFAISGLLVSLVSAVVGVWLLYKLVKEEFDEPVAKKTIFFLLIFPTSFFLLLAYSESLCLALIIADFSFYKKRNLPLTTLFAALASATRLSAVALVLTLWVIEFSRNHINRKNFILLFAPAGLIMYMIYLFNQTGNPLYFLEAERHWLRVLSVPGFGVWQLINQIFMPDFLSKYPTALLDLISFVLGFGLILRSFRFLNREYSLYALFSILIPLSTSSLASFPRFLILIFPIFIVLALMKNKVWQIIYVGVSFLLLCLFSMMYIQGVWVS